LLELTGYQRQELLGQSERTISFRGDSELLRSIETHLDCGGSWSGETRIRRKDGSVLWTHATIVPKQDIHGRTIGTIAVRTDITAVKVATSNRELTEALHQISDEVYVWEVDSYKLVYINERAMQRLSWDQSTYQTMSLKDAVPSLNWEIFNRNVGLLLESSTDRIEMEVILGGKPHDVSIQLINPEAGPQRFVAIFRDVADRAEVERIKEEFIATVSHELRSPLTSIKGALGLMMSGAMGNISEKSRALLDVAHRNVNRLVLIVNDILDMEQIAAGKMSFDMKVDNLADLVSEALSANSAGAARFDVSVVAEGLEKQAFAEFDHARMMQVMTNILSNAIKFSHPGGRVIVALKCIGPSHEISVQDFGVGIPPEALKTIFERFTQAENRSERTGNGTGLGLSITKALVEKHCGSVAITSEWNKGTTVYVRLPRVESITETTVRALSA